MSSGGDALFIPRRVVAFGEIRTSPPTLRTVDVGVDLVAAGDANVRAERGAADDAARDRRKTTPVEWLAARRRAAWTYLGARSPVLRLLPLSGEHWPHGIEMFPTTEAPSILAGTPRTSSRRP